MDVQKNRPLISIIVPVYNVENYLRECLNSILNQTFQDFELILVDDGSTDGSGKTCDMYEKRDPRVMVHHQSNSGVSDARAKGLSLSSGRYIGFVDSDDYIAPEMYEELLRLIIEHDADISCCRYQKFDDNGGVYDDGNLDSNEKISLLTSQQALIGMYEGIFGNDSNIGIVLWNKLYRRELFEQSDFEKNRNELPQLYFEDMMLTPVLLYYAGRVACTRKRLYFYRVIENSLSRSGFGAYKTELYKAKKSTLAFCLELGMGEVYREQLKDYGNQLIKTWLAARDCLPDPAMKSLCSDVLREYKEIYFELLTKAKCKPVYKLSFLIFRINPALWRSLAKNIPLTHIDGQEFI